MMVCDIQDIDYSSLSDKRLYTTDSKPFVANVMHMQHVFKCREDVCLQIPIDVNVSLSLSLGLYKYIVMYIVCALYMCFLNIRFI